MMTRRAYCQGASGSIRLLAGRSQVGSEDGFTWRTVCSAAGLSRSTLAAYLRPCLPILEVTEMNSRGPNGEDMSTSVMEAKEKPN